MHVIKPIALYNVIRREEYIICVCFSVDQIQLGKYNPKRTVSLANDVHQVASLCARLQDMLSAVMQYVDDVIVSV